MPGAISDSVQPESRSADSDLPVSGQRGSAAAAVATGKVSDPTGRGAGHRSGSSASPGVHWHWNVRGDRRASHESRVESPARGRRAAPTVTTVTR